MTLRKEKVLEIERDRTISHCMENWLRKGLWSCGKTEYMKEINAELAIDRHK
jgi:hypothetical protein